MVHPLTVVGESVAIAVGTKGGDNTEAQGWAGPPICCIHCCFHPAGGAEMEVVPLPAFKEERALWRCL
eukprot:2409176-Rhodomonas_salina.1